MSDAFGIELVTTRLTLDEGTPAARVEADVSNALDRHAVVGIEVQGQEPLQPAWVTVEPARFALDVNESRRVGAQVQPPAGTEPGEYRFTLRAYDVDRPADAFATSPPVVAVVRREERQERPAWLLPVLGVVLVLVVGLVAWRLLANGQDEQITGVFTGDALLEGGCLWVETDDGQRFEVLWPQDIRPRPGAIQLMGGGRRVFARDGDRMTVTGEEVDMPTICQVGPVFEATSVEVHGSGG